MTNLFTSGLFQLHGGSLSDWKLECDALTDDDWDTLAMLMARRVNFNYAIGIPRGGTKLASALKKYAQGPQYPVLVVDDVYTSGKSMSLHLWKATDIGFVVFARIRPKDQRIKVLFQFNEE